MSTSPEHRQAIPMSEAPPYPTVQAIVDTRSGNAMNGDTNGLPDQTIFQRNGYKPTENETWKNPIITREHVTSGEYDPYRDDPELKYRFEGNFQIPNFREVLPLKDLMHLKENQCLAIHVIIPTLNEGTNPHTGLSNIGTTIENLMVLQDTGLVDKITVIDTDSTDDTERVVKEHNVELIQGSELLKQHGLDVVRGKGTNLWGATLMHNKESAGQKLVVFCDADFAVRPAQVQGVISPLIEKPSIQLSLAWMDRFTHQGNNNTPALKGGRATEFALKPTIAMFFPELKHIQQPICGLYAGRASALGKCEFPPGYRVETALLIQTLMQHGQEAIAQTFCGAKEQVGKTNDGIAVMAHEITYEVVTRAMQYGRKPVSALGEIVTYPTRKEDAITVIGRRITNVGSTNLPPPTTFIRK